MNRYAIFAIVDKSTERALRQYQEQLARVTGDTLALRFPVHVTVRGPFLANPSSAKSLTESAAQINAKYVSREFAMEIAGPVFVSSSLCWLEVKPHTPGFIELNELHVVSEKAVSENVTRDEVRSAHRGAGYRPHITLSWGAGGCICDWNAAKNPMTLHGSVERIAIAVYPDGWPNEGSVNIL